MFAVIAPPVRAAITARLWIDNVAHEVTLVGRQEQKLQLGVSSAPGALSGTVDAGKVERAQFRIEFEGRDYNRELRNRAWADAIRVMRPAIEPVLPYLDLPDNNAADLALEYGTLILRAAERSLRSDAENAQENAKTLYEAAYEVFAACARVEWSSVGQLGVLKGCSALLALDKPRTAEYYIERMNEPIPGDAAFGHYWLIKADLAARKGLWREAIDDVVRSVSLENKDIETFPDALMLSARAYEALQEWHRARDVYFEIASIFPGTDWADTAVERLKVVLDSGHTEESEERSAERAFFGLDEDIDSLSRELIRKHADGTLPSIAPPPEREDRPGGLAPLDEGPPDE